MAVLARLRNLTRETHKQIKDMGFTYNVTEDYLYKEGLAKGQKAKEKELIVELLKEGTLSVEKIAAVAKVPVERVKKLAKELKK